MRPCSGGYARPAASESGRCAGCSEKRSAASHHPQLRRSCGWAKRGNGPTVDHGERRSTGKASRGRLNRQELSMDEPLLDSRFLERLERLTLHWQRSFPGLVGGHNASRFAGSGQEFLDHRVFHEGDDLRAVNWRAFMRLEKLFLKMFQVEPRVPVRLLLDVSGSMTVGHAAGGVTKFELA